MKKIKLVFLLIIFIFAFNIMINANDTGKTVQKEKTVPVNFSINIAENTPTAKLPYFNSINNNSIKSGIKHYAAKRGKGAAIALIVVGSVLMGLSFLFVLLPGIGLLVAGIILYNTIPNTTIRVGSERRPLYQYLLIPGAVLTGIGGTIFIAGIIMLVVGIVLNTKNRRAQIITEFQDNNLVYGFRIKI